LKVFFGMDFGFSNDVTAIVKTYLDLPNNEIYIDELCYKTQMLSTDIIKELNRHIISHEEIISESADPRLVKEIQLAGLNIHEVEKFKGSIIAGIDKMKTMKIFITERSVNAIREFKNYTYMQDRAGKFLNEPIDDYNHIIDAIRYVVLMKVLGRTHKKKDLSKMGFA
jgi:phage terminase large subunit